MYIRPLLQNNKVVNVIVLDNVDDFSPPYGYSIGPQGGKIGDTWDGEKYTSSTPITLPTPIPASVTNYQGRAALINAGYFNDVNNYIQNLGPTSLEYQAWEYATSFYRDSPFIVSIGATLGLTDKMIDDLFIAASNIS